MSGPSPPGKIVKSGWLTKQGGIVRNWKERWFVLTDTHLHYYKDKEASAPQASISLKQCTSIKGAEEVLQKEYSFQLQTPDRTFYFVASQESEKTDWINAIGRAIIGLSSVMVEDYDPNNPCSMENEQAASAAAAKEKAEKEREKQSAEASRRSSTRYSKANTASRHAYLGDDDL
eukprot:Rmarinus@m.22836